MLLVKRAAGGVGLGFVALMVMACGMSAARGQEKGKWVNISDPVIAKLTAEGKKIGWPGQTVGVVVDRATGDVYMVVCDQGLWKSTDRGKTFQRVDGGAISGRCETGFALNFDPQGKRLACFVIYSPGARTEDAGQTWSGFKQGNRDFGAVDWEATGQTMLGVTHHTEGLLGITADDGQTWTLAAPVPTEIGLGSKAARYRVGPNFAWDPLGNIFYASSMAKPTLKFER